MLQPAVCLKKVDDPLMTTSHRRAITVVAAIAGATGLAALTLTGCSSSTTPSPTPTSPSTTNPTASGSSVLPPIPISKAEDVTVKVGGSLNVITPNVTKVTTNNSRVLQVTQPHSDGSATFNGGARVAGTGTATLTVYGGITNAEMYTVKVTAIAG